MAKILLETSLGNGGNTWFSVDGNRVNDRKAVELIKSECNPYNTNENGVLVYLTEQEYLQLKDKLVIKK